MSALLGTFIHRLERKYAEEFFCFHILYSSACIRCFIHEYRSGHFKAEQTFEDDAERNPFVAALLAICKQLQRMVAVAEPDRFNLTNTIISTINRVGCYGIQSEIVVLDGALGEASDALRVRQSAHC